MKILIWIIVALVIVGGLAWFLSSDKPESSTQTQEGTQANIAASQNEVTAESSINSDNQVLEEIDNALAGLE